MMRDGWALPQRAGRGDVPKWYLEEPRCSWAEQAVIDAFFDLDTCRPASFSLGQIPWLAIAQYVDRLGLPADVSSCLVRAVRVLDGAYLDWREKNARAATPIEQQRSPRG